jgi:hypothetical protein
MGINPSLSSEHRPAAELTDLHVIYLGKGIGIDYGIFCKVSEAIDSISTGINDSVVFDEQTLKALGFEAINNQGIAELGFDTPTDDQRNDLDVALCTALIVFEVARRRVIACASKAKRDELSRKHLAAMHANSSN